ncbi:hypothetical protein HU200_001839 [Digitaria exilis]|uniref:PPPDE domain-containing protein n=1 Tax=Digitaria exilis TaxID=1010633 RepID=A0A835KXA8_9POAL|nr:hypothetical protein HU200_001839 [Digitaria exilis]
MMMGSGEEGEEGCAGGVVTAMSSAASTGRGQEVVLHVYDVGRTGCDKTDRTVRNINRFFKDCIGVGGIFHTAVQVYGDEESSFGFCYCGTGVFRCPTRQNPMYRYRESIVLGVTSFSEPEVNQILTELSFDWCGFSYDLLSRNCNHFTNEFCEKLGARKSPGWVNRFANVIYSANVFAGTTVQQFRQAKSDIANASRAAYDKFMTGLGQNNQDNAETQTINQNPSSSWFQGNWFKNMVLGCAKPTTERTQFSREADDDSLLQGPIEIEMTEWV